MFATTALIIGLSTLAFVLIMSWIGVGWLWGVLFAVVFNIVQWLLAPYFIELLYGIREIRPEDNPWLHRVAEKLSRVSGIPKPKIMLADLPIPNAFAYGTPFTGARVAITRGLLRVLEPDEVEAVLGHEFGHIRHRDMQIMMLASLLPAIFYWLGQILLRASQGEREEADLCEVRGDEILGGRFVFRHLEPAAQCFPIYRKDPTYHTFLRKHGPRPILRGGSVPDTQLCALEQPGERVRKRVGIGGWYDQTGIFVLIDKGRAGSNLGGDKRQAGGGGLDQNNADRFASVDGGEAEDVGRIVIRSHVLNLAEKMDAVAVRKPCRLFHEIAQQRTVPDDQQRSRHFPHCFDQIPYALVIAEDSYKKNQLHSVATTDNLCLILDLRRRQEPVDRHAERNNTAFLAEMGQYGRRLQIIR